MYRDFLKISISISSLKVILENIGIDIDIDKVILENIDIVKKSHPKKTEILRSGWGGGEHIYMYIYK